MSPLLATATGHGSSVIAHIAVAMVAASVAGFAARMLRQPLLLGYILAGVLVGPLGLGLIAEHADIANISELGLILLLFMIGLEIDLKKMLGAGRFVIVPGIVQFPVSVAVTAGCVWLLQRAGLQLGHGRFAALYLGLAVALSSTMIVVKLLYDRQAIDTIAGRITVGILVFQDLWAIVALAVQPTLNTPDARVLLRTFISGAVVVAATLLTSRFVLPRIFKRVAKVPELLLVLSLGWCFLVGMVAALPVVGLSMGMGALIAGVALATFPYNLDVNARVLNIRDFFITLFFVSLGMQITLPTVGVLTAALLLSGILVVARVLSVFGVLSSLRSGRGTALLATINLSQVSEFALVIVGAGVSLGHVDNEVLSIVLWTFALSAVGSTYAINFSEAIVRWFGGDPTSKSNAPASEQERGIVMLGYFRIARAFVENVAREDQHLLERLRVIDFNPETGQQLEPLGVPCLYGDVANLDTLHHAGIEHAEVVLCTVPDTYLRGTSNERLLKLLRPLCPDSRIVVTAETPEQAVTLYAEGADFVLQPSLLAGAALVNAVEQATRGTFEAMREEAREDLDARTGSHSILAG